MRLAASAAVALTLVLAPTAGADSIAYTIVSGVQGDNGWYRSAVSVQITASAPTTCPTTATFASSSSVVDCTWGANNVPFHLQFKIDTDAPVVKGATADRGPDVNGWYTHPVNVAFSGSDGTSGLAGCSAGTYSGPDSATASVTGSCRDNAGNVSETASLPLKYDATPPATTATPTRPPNSQGWYTDPVSVKFAATDATSGVASCTDETRYRGPDNAAVSLTGTCTDQAGNQSSATFTLKYDSTPPRVSDVATSVSGDVVTVTWQHSQDASGVIVLRAPGRANQRVSIVYRGPAKQFRDSTVRPGVVYHYTVAATDAAGNDARVKVAAGLRPLYAPAPGARVAAGAVLRWTATAGATYYNLQLFRGGKKVLSTWPVRARFRLPRSWTFAGHRYALERGSYAWYVWPGLGQRSKGHYGKLLGGSTFTVR
jgi:hypothetical protein